MSKSLQHENVVPSPLPYTRSNPPASINVAEKRLDELDIEIARIDTQLQHIEFEDFETDDQYDSWKRRALAALGAKQSERDYLERWVRRGGEEPAPRVSAYNPALEGTAEALRAEVRNTAKDFRKKYVPKYTRLSLPGTSEIAEQRLSVLTGLKIELQCHFSAFNNKWTSNRLSKNKLSAAKAPLQTILVEIESEIIVVKLAIKST